jgi:hypothetical protein
MAGSPFGPEVPPDLYADAGVSTPPSGEMPVDTRRSGGDAALQALAALAMLAPMGRGVKGLAASLGLGGGLMLASGASAASKAKPAAKKGAAAEPAAAPPAAEAPAAPADEVKDEYTEEMTFLRQQAHQMGIQVERMGQQAAKGSQVLPQTASELKEARAALKGVTDRIGEITKERAARAKGERQQQLDREKAAENERKAKEGEATTNMYRGIGGGLGLTAGALMAYLAHRKLKGAVRGFEETASDVNSMLNTKGNVMVSKGNLAPDLHAGVNTAYKTGGAKPPLPPLGAIHNADSPAALKKAKDEFLTGTKIPDETMGSIPGLKKKVPNSPFEPARAEKLSKGPSIAEKGIPLAFGGDAAGALGTSYLTDNPDRKDMLQNMSWLGATGLIGYGLARKGGAAFARATPNELSRRAVESGKERVVRDAMSVQHGDMVKFARNQGAVGVGGLPKPKGEFKPGDGKRMSELRDLRSVKGQARTDFVSKAHMDDRIVQAHAASIGPDGKVDRAAFRKALRQIYTATHDHGGEKLKMDDRMVAALMKAFGSR